MGHLLGEKSVELFRLADQILDQRFDKLVECRRHLHKHPELSWQETETTEFIRKQLAECQLKLNPGPLGLGGTVDIGDFHKCQGNQRIAVRGDIDAIPVTEANEVDYCSRVSQVMHACGHDVHTTVMLGICQTLSELLRRRLLADTFFTRILFQPAEEVAQGATEMIAHGALDGINSILAMHVDPKRLVGTIGLRSHIQTANCDDLKIRITAEGGHGARPHETTDPIFAATQLVNAVYAQIPRIYDNRHAAVLSFCRIEGGKSANVIPTQVSIQGTLRSFDLQTRDTIMVKLKNICRHIGHAFGAHVELEPGVHIPSVNNAPNLISLMTHAAETFLPDSSILQVDASMGAEDFACYQEHIDGALVRIGSANEKIGAHPLHSPHFDIDEEAIRIGCQLLTRSVLMWNFPSPEIRD